MKAAKASGAGGSSSSANNTWLSRELAKMRHYVAFVLRLYTRLKFLVLTMAEAADGAAAYSVKYECCT